MLTPQAQDVPAIYFVRPTAENIELIAQARAPAGGQTHRWYTRRNDRGCRPGQDCARGLYAQSFVNFATSVPRPLLEALAERTVKTNSVGRIVKARVALARQSSQRSLHPRVSQIFDQFCDFVALESGLVSLNKPNSYARFYGGGQDEKTMEVRAQR